MNIDYAKLIDISKKMRLDILDMTHGMGHVGAHIGGGMSLVEIMCVLYNQVMNFDISRPFSDERDRFILSKGHGTLALYTAMSYAGIINHNELSTYKKNETELYAHPSVNTNKFIDYSSGSLGQGLSLGVGTALGLMRKNNTSSKVYVVLGDGECNEGSVWEAAQSAAQFKCRNLVAIVDKNGLQYDGKTTEIMNDSDISATWRSFGWEVVEVDGHDVKQLCDVFYTEHKKPFVVIARTVKGKGVSFMENNPLWHNHSLSDQQYEQAVAEVKGEA